MSPRNSQPSLPELGKRADAEPGERNGKGENESRAIRSGPGRTSKVGYPGYPIEERRPP
jgi:hypothetical protein